ncbi:MAG: hypothetical protein ACOYI7_06580 [Candidatus Excrementavichristensenella sp.]
MNKLVSMLLVLLLLLASPALAADGSVDVVMEGATYHLTLTGVEIAEGKLTVTVEGFGETLRMGANGWMIAAWPIAHFGDEAIRADDVNAIVGGPFTFNFERGELPDEIWMDPYDEAEDEVLIWQADAPAGSDDAGSDQAAAAGIPPEIVGEWHGTGTPKNGGPSIDLTITIGADGSGEYTFHQSGYYESNPFMLSRDGNRFSVNTDDSQLGSCEGTWALEGGILTLDIVTTFPNGGSYAYTAECVQAAKTD